MQPFGFNITKDSAGRTIVEVSIGGQQFIFAPELLSQFGAQAQCIGFLAMQEPAHLRKLADQKDSPLITSERPKSLILPRH
jgi:hypothetical protein